MLSVLKFGMRLWGAGAFGALIWVLVCALICWGLLGCNGGKNRTNIELIRGMMDQRSLKAQDWDGARGKPAAMLPPRGTLPMGHEPYKHSFESSAALEAPAEWQALSLEQLQQAKELYRVYCAVCHGAGGRGKGTVGEFLTLQPPDLLAAQVKAYAAGQLYHIITQGYGQMRSYKNLVREPWQRWAIVGYVRHLQGQ